LGTVFVFLGGRWRSFDALSCDACNNLNYFN
jgi:hypothetical protein